MRKKGPEVLLGPRKGWLHGKKAFFSIDLGLQPPPGTGLIRHGHVCRGGVFPYESFGPTERSRMS